MAFWGVELKPDKPYTHPSSKTSGRLRLSQATLGFGSSSKKSLVQCNVGKKSPVLLCCLLPDKSEYCHLELEFDEDDEVVFSVIGPRSVHLSGYYLATGHRHRGNFNDSSESYGEDIGHSDTEKSHYSTDEDDYEDSFINDGDVQVSPPSPGFTSDEMEDMMDDEKCNKKKGGRRRRHLRKYQISESEDDGKVKVLESEDDDKILISSLFGCGGTTKEQKLAKDIVGDHTGNHSDVKANGNNGGVDADSKRDPDVQHTSVPSPTVGGLPRNEEELKAGNKRSKKRGNKSNTLYSDSIDDNHKDEVPMDATTGMLQEPPNEGKSDAYVQSDEKKSKKKKRKVKGNEDVACMEKQAMPTKESAMTLETKQPDGLAVEDLVMGKPDGEVASSGRKVKIHYTGMLKEGGNVYESSIGSKPLKYRLGKGRLVAGVELGLEGMRVGGRRRLTIPPELGYGREGVVNSVPPNSWLTIDVDLLNVR